MKLYPRPDFERFDSLILDGYWKFQFDDYEQYTIEEMSDPSAYEKKILVPYPYQSRKSGIHDETFHDVVWYLNEFIVPKGFLEKRTLLKFGAVDYYSEVWLNDVKIGSHKGGYDPFYFDVTNVLKEKNVLVVRVVDKHGDQPRGKQDSNPHPRGCRYMRVTGIWQPVWLEKVGDLYIENIRVYPRLSGEIEIGIEMNDVKPDARIFIDAYFYEGEVGSYSGPIETKNLNIKLNLDEIHAWDTEDPDIYSLMVRVENKEEVEDTVKSYFGLREIKVSDGKIFLNGEPLYFQAVLEQGYYPDGIYTPNTLEDFLNDLNAVKEMGFNGVRAHQKPPDPRYLYFADRLGVLVWDEMGDWGMTLTDENIKDFLVQWKNIVIRDFNHPSIVAWVPFNERDDAYNDPQKQKLLALVYEETKKLDPTRPIVDTSGYSHVKTDILDIHDYKDTRLTGRRFKKLWDEYKAGKREMPASGHLMSTAFEYQKQPIIISEFGGWGIEGQEPIVKRPEWAYMLLSDKFDLERKYRDIVLAMADVPEIVGYCYTQLYDVEGELNGFLTYDRKWKVDPSKIKEANIEAYKRWLKNEKK